MKNILFLSAAAAILALTGCKKDEPTVLAELSIPLSTQFMIPAPGGATAYGMSKFKFLSDNTMEYALTVDSLIKDTLILAHIHLGNPAANGSVFLNLVDNKSTSFNGGTNISGTVKLTDDQRTTLLAEGVNFYVNLHSRKAISPGVLRGQWRKTVTEGKDIFLNNTVAGRTESGSFYLRSTVDSTYTNVIVPATLDGGDTLVAATLRAGVATQGIAGAKLVTLCNSVADFKKGRAWKLPADVKTALTQPCYITVETVQHPEGLLIGTVTQ